MTVKHIARTAASPNPRFAMPDTDGLIRKTRLMSKVGVLLIRVEVFQGETLRSTHLRLTTPAGSEIFTDMDRALAAFRALLRPPVEKARLKTAA